MPEEPECRGTCVWCQRGIYDDLAMCCDCWEENLSKRDLKIKQLAERVKGLEEAAAEVMANSGCSDPDCCDAAIKCDAARRRLGETLNRKEGER